MTGPSKLGRRNFISIKDQLIILDQYDNLAPHMPNAKKAENLGIKRGQLLSILSRRNKISTMKNTAMQRAVYGKERKVADAALQWLQSAMESHEKISYSIIQRKASEIC